MRKVASAGWRRGNLPVFRIRKEPFEWIVTGKKNVELRRGKAKRGDSAIFLNGKNRTIRAKIIKRQEGRLGELLNSSSFRNIVPTARSLEEAMEYVTRIYPSAEGIFTAYEIEINMLSLGESKKTDK